MNNPDTFFHLTATSWTAIGSITGAATVLALVIFSILNLKKTRQMAAAASTQAKAAEGSLAALKLQMLGDAIARREIAVDALRKIGNNCRIWANGLHASNIRAVMLIPDSWASVMAFVAEQPQNVREAMQTLSEALPGVEATLTAYMQHGLFDRRELTPERQALVGDLERYAKMSNELATKLSANR